MTDRHPVASRVLHVALAVAVAVSAWIGGTSCSSHSGEGGGYILKGSTGTGSSVQPAERPAPSPAP
jgi:hypothetical protein